MKDKIAIIGMGQAATDLVVQELAKMGKEVIVIEPKEAINNMNIKPPLVPLNYPKRLTLTRKERRAIERKNKKK